MRTGRQYTGFNSTYVQDGMCMRYLILSEVTQCLHLYRLVALLIRVSWFQSHNALGFIDQLLYLLLVLLQMFLLFLMTHKHNIV